MIAHYSWFLQRVCNNKAGSCALTIANVIFHLHPTALPHMSWSPPRYITRLLGYLLSQEGGILIYFSDIKILVTLKSFFEIVLFCLSINFVRSRTDRALVREETERAAEGQEQ